MGILTRSPRSAILPCEGVSAMATRAAKPEPADWRAAFRRSMARALQLTSAVALYFASGFLFLALVSYHQTDPSFSTAANGPPLNWMGYPGAWAADLTLL